MVTHHVTTWLLRNWRNFEYNHARCRFFYDLFFNFNLVWIPLQGRKHVELLWRYIRSSYRIFVWRDRIFSIIMRFTRDIIAAINPRILNSVCLALFLSLSRSCFAKHVRRKMHSLGGFVRNANWAWLSDMTKPVDSPLLPLTIVLLFSCVYTRRFSVSSNTLHYSWKYHSSHT